MQRMCDREGKEQSLAAELKFKNKKICVYENALVNLRYYGKGWLEICDYY